MLIRARSRAVVSENILAGLRGAGLVSSNPQRVLDRLPKNPVVKRSNLRTPPDRPNLDFSLLKSSPPDGTELRESNVMLNSVLTEVPNVPTPARRYVDRVTRMAETQNAERRRMKGATELMGILQPQSCVWPPIPLVNPVRRRRHSISMKRSTFR
jgi:hypothetical protein